MYVCLCNGVTDTQITALLAGGNVGMRELRQELNVGTQCGRCTCAARQMVNRFYHISEPGSAARVTHIHLYEDESTAGADSRQVA
jgi:bacterioferritin-associated ferredoxin